MESNYAGTPYDYQSIMHYGKKAFIQAQYAQGNTIEHKFDPLMEIGSSVELSKTDIKELNARYQCHGELHLAGKIEK